jgi:hypothetical protein
MYSESALPSAGDDLDLPPPFLPTTDTGPFNPLTSSLVHTFFFLPSAGVDVAEESCAEGVGPAPWLAEEPAAEPEEELCPGQLKAPRLPHTTAKQTLARKRVIEPPSVESRG